MNLYDQGRYAEAWLKFRESSQADKKYVEAVYWVGKMYYFMYRYDHARRSLEKFVYLNCLHPRMGDALMEYAHTFESSGAAPAELLKLYSAFGQRFPDVSCGRLHRDRLGSTGLGWYYLQGTDLSRLGGRDWARYKIAMLFMQTGREADAARMTGPATMDSGLATLPSDGILNLLACNARTGIVPDDEVIAYADWPRVKRTMLHFTQTNALQEYRLAEPETIIGQGGESSNKSAALWSENCTFDVYLLAPSGCVFRSLRFAPVAEGDDATMSVALRRVGFYKNIDKATVIPLDLAHQFDMTLGKVPSTGMLIAHCEFQSKDGNSAAVTVRGVNITAKLERIDNPGSLDVQCQDTQSFRVDVDGAFGRWWPGIVGPLTPGEHTLTYRPMDARSPYAQWSTKVNVQAGKTTRVVGRLPWKDHRDAALIDTAWVGRDYDSYNLALNEVVSAPAVQADDGAIRLVWSRGGDLWSSVSTDGKTFSRPRKLPLPVSTAWVEYSPRLMRDKSGRFSLSFISDRDEQHRPLLYLCWSSDFVHWSAPCAVSEFAPVDYDMMLAPDGKYYCLLSLVRGSDKPGTAWSADEFHGVYGVMYHYALPGDRPVEGALGSHEIRRLSSSDGYNWTTLAKFPAQESTLRLAWGEDGKPHMIGFHASSGDSQADSGMPSSSSLGFGTVKDLNADTLPHSITIIRTDLGMVTLLGDYREKTFFGETAMVWERGGRRYSTHNVFGLARGYSSFA